MSDSFVAPWTVAHQAPLPMGFSRQEYWSGLPCPPPGDLPHPGIDSAGRFFTTSATREGLGAPTFLPVLWVIFLWFFQHNLLLNVCHIWLRSNLYNKIFILPTPGWTLIELMLKMIEFLELVCEKGYYRSNGKRAVWRMLPASSNRVY